MFRTLIFVMVSLFTGAVQGSQALLEQFFAEVNTMEADFDQRVVDENGMTLEYATGRFYLSRPGKFRWDYNSNDPDLEEGQTLVADGRSIYMYDPDLEQVTQRQMNDALAQVPSLILVQEGGALQEHFEVIDIGPTDGMSWVALRPKDEDAGYQQLMMAFADSQLSTIVLLDGLGNETRLRLSNVVANGELAGETFEFQVPPSADLLSQ
ncbi:MAG: outer membrane lipoprotein chaperone LolA [Pseudomonadota bacterium]